MKCSPVGVRPVKRRFKVSGLFETGFFEIDDNWAYLAMGAAQKALSVDQINQIELNVDDLNRAVRNRQGRGEGGGRALHHHHLDGAQQATAGRAQDGAAGDHHRDQPDRTRSRAEHFHHPGNDGDGEVPRHRRPHVDGRAPGTDPPHLHAAGRADRPRRQRDRPGSGPCPLLPRRKISLDSRWKKPSTR